MSVMRVWSRIVVLPARMFSFLKISGYLRFGVTLLFLLFVLVAIEPLLARYVMHYPTLKMGAYGRLMAPSREHILGTDQYGRDVLMVQLVGLKNSLLIGVFAGGLATIVSTVVAIVAGYSGGRVDALLNSVINAVMVIPSLPILIAIASFVSVDLATTCLIIAVFGWAGSARRLRAQILSLKERDYIDLARVSGDGEVHIMFAEILPNVFPFIGVGFANSVMGAILTETGLRLLGLGPGLLETLGAFLNRGLSFGAISLGHANIVLAPSFFLILIFTAINFINAGAEQIFNPRLKRTTGT